MDESGYWAALERSTAIAVGADVARAAVLAVAPLVNATHEALVIEREALRELRENPGRRGAGWTRAALSAEIARLERQERRLLIRLEALREFEAKHQAELARLAPMRESTTRLLDSMTADFEAMHAAEERAAREAAEKEARNAP